MAKVLQHRRGTSSEHANFTGAAGEITFDTTAKRLVAHDGTTKGGIPVATKQEVEQVANSLDPRILDAASQADIIEAVSQATVGNVSGVTLEGLQAQISANTSNIAAIPKPVTPTRYVVETWSSGTEWYEKYNDGWIRQGGTLSPTSNGLSVFSLVTPMATTDYTIIGSHIGYTTNTYTAIFNAKTTTNFEAKSGVSGYKIDWRAEGY